MSKLKNRYYGIMGVAVDMANWNADFSGYPKQNMLNEFYGSDKAFKYAVRDLMKRNGEKVLFVRNKKEDAMPLSLAESYQKCFGEEVKATTPAKDLLKNLFNAVDVEMFGAAFAFEKNNHSIHGAIQFGHGINIDPNTSIIDNEILSPFQNSNKEAAKKETTGHQTYLDNAMFTYPFSVNPKNYDIYNETGIEDFEGLTEEGMEKFIKYSNKAVTALNSCAKMGCSNAFSLYIKLKEDSEAYMPPLHRYVKYERRIDSSKHLDLTKLNELLTRFSNDIESVDLYVNELELEVELGGLDNLPGFSKHDILV